MQDQPQTPPSTANPPPNPPDEGGTTAAPKTSLISGLAMVLATGLGSGRLPKAPGTWGSVAALPFAWLLHEAFGTDGLIVAAGIVFMVGIWASAVAMQVTGEEDPGWIVIDEVAGLWLTLGLGVGLAHPATTAGAVTPDVVTYVLGFLLFRIFDVFKPWPISWADRHIKGGFGVMFDDILAGLWAAAVLAAIDFWLLPL